jgi:two-component system sensor histidine kinase PhoQ
MRSLRARVLLATAIVLIFFVALTSVALEQAFQDTARSAQEERLLGQIYLLMAAAEAEDAGLVLPIDLAEARFSLPGSGLYGRILDGTGRLVWESASAVGIDVPFEEPLAPGKRLFELREDGEGRPYLVEAFGVRWATGARPQAYTFAVAEDLDDYHRALAGFRTSLYAWLGAMALLTLTALLVAMRWGLAPLGRVAEEVAAVESGRQQRVRGDYPEELRALTDNLNALLAHERAQQQRLGNALGDLAHSLKTPLAVLGGALGAGQIDRATEALLEEQIEHMGRIVEYQLHRARTRAGTAAGLTTPTPVRQVVDRLVAYLQRVYADKGITVTTEVDPTLVFRGVEGDLMELLGNLLDNAFKWGRRQVRIGAVAGAGGIAIAVEDDGPGIEPGAVERLLARGARGDEAAPGHGIGLAVVRDIAQAYGGAIQIERGVLGGARVAIQLPA